ncbi:hypothetical protein [Thalassomonas haliotis]|uniref:Ankyrin n=1 Tax=Thalassomonas haliotis TaxID=485448 RepID=A0ABY7VCX6_9GAMM|nr:hypothetical protein [Thalassomonas haliotis]WDE11401.1 hypothetical protein H3N35_24810 [Thalassomonas haliotis]
MKFFIGLLIVVFISVCVLDFNENSVNIENKDESLVTDNSNEVKVLSPQKSTLGSIFLDNSERPMVGNTGSPENQITDKLSFDKANKSDVKKLRVDFEKDLEQGNISTELNKNMQGLFESAQKADWEKFNSTVDFLESEDSNTLSLALFQAVLNNAPLTVIENLLSRGAVFIPQTAQMLALKNNVKLTKNLLSLGLDLHVVDQSGKNSLSHTLVSFQSKEMFDFLLVHNVNVKPNPNGLDPLDMALQYTLYNAQGIYYVRKLLEYGAPIESSHIQLLTQMKENNPHNYEKIAGSLPYQP